MLALVGHQMRPSTLHPDAYPNVAADASVDARDAVNLWDLPPMTSNSNPNKNNGHDPNATVIVEEPNRDDSSLQNALVTVSNSNEVSHAIVPTTRPSNSVGSLSDAGGSISIAMDGPSPSPHFVSLENVARLYLEMKNEREFLVRQAASIFNERVTVVNQLRQLEVQLNHLLQQKLRLEENLDSLGLRDEENRSKIASLDEKVANISSESLRFEAIVRDLKRGDPDSTASDQPPVANHTPQPDLLQRRPTTTSSTVSATYKQPSPACKRTLYGHTGSVLGLEVCSTTKVLITASSDRSLRTWDLSSGHRLDTLYGHQGWVHAVTFSLDGQTAVSGSGDKTVKVWDLNPSRGSGRGSCRLTLRGHDAGVTCVQLDDDNILVSGSLDRTLRRVDLNSGHDLDDNCTVIQGHDNGVYCLQFVRHGIASGGGDGLIRMHDVRTGRCHRTLQGHTGGAVRALQFNDNQLISGGSDHDLRFWDLRTASCTATVNVGSRINALQFDAQCVYVGCADRTLKVYDTNTQSLITEHGGHLGPIISLASYDHYYYTGSADQTTKVWLLPPPATSSATQ